MPDAGVSTNKLSPIACRPDLLAKTDNSSWPTTVGVVPPARLGEHTDEILASVGYSANEIAAMRKAGAAA